MKPYALLGLKNFYSDCLVLPLLLETSTILLFTGSRVRSNAESEESEEYGAVFTPPTPIHLELTTLLTTPITISTHDDSSTNSCLEHISNVIIPLISAIIRSSAQRIIKYLYYRILHKIFQYIQLFIAYKWCDNTSLISDHLILCHK